MATVLLIDDDPAIRWMLRLALEQAGHAVLEATNGQRGHELYEGNAVDLIVTDIYMPDFDGIEFILRLRHADPDVPVIAMSGGNVHGELVDLLSARRLGATATIAKPFRMLDFMSLLTRMLADRAGSAGSGR